MKLKTKSSFVIAITVAVLGAGFIAFAFSDPSEAPASPVIKHDSSAVVVVNREFGLPIDSYAVTNNTIRRNEFLANILQQYGVSYQTVAALAQKSKEIFDVRDMTAGSNYTVFCTRDSMRKACFFVYQPNAIDYIVYDLRDSLRVYKGAKTVTTKLKTVSGVITSSLYETMDEEAANPALAVSLANIYAWTIDFFAIQKGDWFKVVYDEDYVKGVPVGLGQIKSAVFSHDGEKFYAFYFQPDSTKEGTFFDEHGKSLRKAFLKAPLKFFHITSHYSKHRFHPIQKRWKAHLGTDYAAPTGTPIMSTGDGTVIASRYSRFNGNYVKIRHNGTYTTQYLHMSKRAVKVGQYVRQGQVIGYVGSTGLATGPHVCYRFWKNGKQVDPLKQHFPAAKPVDQEALPLFEKIVHTQEQKLAAIPAKSRAS
jgi:murein DD-endopeptidase MepM/ murein hydrolase activator NlpD